MKKLVAETTYTISETMLNVLMYGLNVVCKNNGYR